MLRSCKYCGRIHDEKYICPKKPAKRKDSTEAVSFRSSNAWKKKRNEIRQRDKFCRVCLLSTEETKDKYNTSELSVHHIVPIDEDYEKRLDDDNLITLCSSHHKGAETGRISRELLLMLAAQDVQL